MSAGGKVVVAMSGGVDSSTTAALLKEQGWDVIGIGLKLPLQAQTCESSKSCCGVAGMDDARRVADAIGIPFYVLNYEEFFKQSVVDYFVEAYARGLTPNPCVECNRIVKFGRLLKQAEAFGADFLATGHYARVERDEATGRYLLKKGIDRERDQSYFLYSLDQRQLCRAMFPLGGMTKEQARELARKFNLPVSEKPGSQDVCFLGDSDYRELVARKFPSAFASGPIINTKGEEIGRHSGVAAFTIGQRRGLRIAAGVPLYVISIDVDSGAVVVGTRDELMTSEIVVVRLNWILFDNPPDNIRAEVKARYRKPSVPAEIRVRGEKATVRYDTPQTAFARGQSAVFYDGDIVLGGGIISEGRLEKVATIG